MTILLQLYQFLLSNNRIISRLKAQFPQNKNGIKIFQCSIQKCFYFLKQKKILFKFLYFQKAKGEKKTTFSI